MNDTNDFERVKQACNLQDIICRETCLQIKKKHLEECPFCKGHDCFSISPEDGFFKCFQCDKKGDVFNFLMEFHGMDIKDALYKAAAMAGVELNKNNSARKITGREKLFLGAAAYYHQCISVNGGGEYFTRIRGHSPEVIQKMGLGYADGKLCEYLKQEGFTFDDMVESGLVKTNPDGGYYDFFRKGLAIFPHYLAGRVVHFTMKDPEKKIKPYQLPADKRHKSWRFYNQDALRYDELFVVEGENDLLSLLDAGVYGVIATSGQVQDVQLASLKHTRGKRLFLWMDNDEDPERPYTKGKGYIRKICTASPGMQFLIIVYPETAKDPDEHLRKFATPKEKRLEVEQLKSMSVDYVSWEIIQAGRHPDMEKKLSHLARFKIFNLISNETEIKQLVYTEKLEALGFSRKAIEDQLETETDIRRKLALYYESLSKKADADPVLISDMLFQHFKNTGRFFRTKKEEVFLLYKNRTYEINNNLPFNALLMRQTDLLPTKEPGRSVWVALANRGYTNGVEIQAANWLYTDFKSDTVFVSLNAPDNTILKIGRKHIEEIPNGLNNDNVLLKTSSAIEPFSYLPDATMEEGFEAIRELLFNSLACETEQRYLIIAWMISAFLFDLSNMQALMKFTGSRASGKTTGARLISILFYGIEDVGSQSSASAFAEASRNPALFIDNLEQKNLNSAMTDFLLLAASKSSKTKRAAGTDSDTIKERPKSLVLITAIEPFTVSELISRTVEIEFHESYFSDFFMDSEATRKLRQKRDLILTCLIKLVANHVLPELEDRKNYMVILKKEYKNHAQERNNEYLALLMVILKAILRYLPYYGKDNVLYGMKSGEAEVRKRWIEYQNERSREQETGSNDILKMLEGILKDYIYAMSSKEIGEVYDVDRNKKVFKYTHEDYGLEITKTMPEGCFDEETHDFVNKVEIEFMATSGDMVYAFDAYCKNKGLKNPYTSAAVFGQRLKNDIKVLKTQSWDLVSKEEIYPYFKYVHGARYYRFVKTILS